MYTHVRLNVHSRSAQGTLTLGSKYPHASLKLQSRLAQGTLTIGSKDTHAQLNVHSRSAQCTLTLGPRYGHGQRKFHGTGSDVLKFDTEGHTDCLLISEYTVEGRTMMVFVSLGCAHIRQHAKCCVVTTSHIETPLFVYC